MGFAMDPSKDWLVPYYRDLALVLRFGMTPRDVMLSPAGACDEPNSGGRQMPGHYGSRKRRISPASSPVGTQIARPPALPMPPSCAARTGDDHRVRRGRQPAQGDFHEGMNCASIHKLGVIFFCQNNDYAISVPSSKQMAVENVADRAAGIRHARRDRRWRLMPSTSMPLRRRPLSAHVAARVRR